MHLVRKIPSEFSSNAAIYFPDSLACVELLVFDGIARGKFFKLSALYVLYFSQGGQYLDLFILLESCLRCVLLLYTAVLLPFVSAYD